MSVRSRKIGRMAMRKRVSRLHAVQALFQMEVTGLDAAEATECFVAHGVGRQVDDMELSGFDEEHLRKLVVGAATNQDQLDELAANLLSRDWPLQRIDPTLRALIRAAGAELLLGSTPPRVTISEFVEVADSFFPGGRQVSLINAILDKMARNLQPAAFD
ncbi:MAG: transcription antitermination factor NusB [Rhodobacteraceae bacterium]|nr:transcription antitermination factor NusB [Paracoccaceae bacterium]